MDEDTWEMSRMERRYSVPPSNSMSELPTRENRFSTSEDLHAWSIYRQNLNSDFTDSALGSTEKSPLPYGNFQLQDSTVHSILSHPKYGPKSELGANAFSYLKFGLPRVLPPSRLGRHENSSGYDSSDDGTGRHRQSPHSQLGSRRNWSKSDPDFRNHVIASSGQQVKRPSGLPRTGDEGRESTWWAQERRMKSSSEANLLASDYYHPQGGARNKRSAQRGPGPSTARERSITPSPAPPRDMAVPIHYEEMKGARSRMGSRMSYQSQPSGPTFGALLGSAYPRETSMVNEKYFPKDVAYPRLDEGNDGVYQRHPHLQIRGLSCEHKRKRILENISLEVRAGEILGILATSEMEGTALLDILADVAETRSHRVWGDMVLNGVTLLPSGMANRVAYVQKSSNYTPDMTVEQTLNFATFMRSSGHSRRKLDRGGKVEAIIQDLGLEQVRTSRVDKLTASEKQRLHVACHLLLETDIVLLDRAMQGMDIFDTFFLIEYLRQWALRGRIIVMTLHPPTYEIFTMLSRVALLSAGRIMYFGRRREMLPYFAFIEFPCPAYKNPSDYYLDLVTLDNLSTEAMLESSQRVEHLAETFRRRQEPLSDPGPPGVLPPKLERRNFLMQTVALWGRALYFTFPSNVASFVRLFCLASTLSIILGGIYWQVRSNTRPEQENVSDRLSFYYVVGAVALWPILMLMAHDVWKDKAPVQRDVDDGMYSKFAYFLAMVSYSFPAAGCIFLAYLIPAYAMAGIDDLTKFGYYVGYMLLYLFAIRAMVIAFIFCFDSKHKALAASGLILTCVALCSGFVVQVNDLGPWVSWFNWFSPLHWTLEPLYYFDMNNVTNVECARNPSIKQETPAIVVKVPCGVSNGNQILRYVQNSFQAGEWIYLLLIVAFGAVFQIVQTVAFLTRKNVQRNKKKNKLSS